MRAVVYDSYGSPDVLELREVAIPTSQAHELLVRVCAAGINPFDWHHLRGVPYLVRLVNGLRRPRESSVIGHEHGGRRRSCRWCGDERYDVILDTVGNRSPSEYRRVLAAGGVYGATGGGGGRCDGSARAQRRDA